MRGKAGGNDYANCNPNIVRLKPWWWAKIFDNSSDCCNPNIVRLKLKASENIVIVRKCCNPNIVRLKRGRDIRKPWSTQEVVILT